MQVADKVKGLLLGEMAGAEWELLEEKEWDGQEDGGEGETIAEGDDGRGKGKGKGDVGGVADAGGGESLGSKTITAGTSGWTKLKPR